MFTNRWLWAAIGLVVAVQVAVVHVGVMQLLFDTMALSAQQWLVAVALSTLPVLTTEFRTRILGRTRWSPSSSHVGQ
jgi:magnesium-transporting ATPase (P-type)